MVDTPAQWSFPTETPDEILCLYMPKFMSKMAHL